MRINLPGEPEDGQTPESEALTGGRDLDREDQEIGHDLRQNLRKLLHECICVLVTSATFGLVFLGGVWFIHLALPERMYWLSSHQLDTIKTILFSGVVGGVISEHLKKNL